MVRGFNPLSRIRLFRTHGFRAEEGQRVRFNPLSRIRLFRTSEYCPPVLPMVRLFQSPFEDSALSHCQVIDDLKKIRKSGFNPLSRIRLFRTSGDRLIS